MSEETETKKSAADFCLAACLHSSKCHDLICLGRRYVRTSNFHIVKFAGPGCIKEDDTQGLQYRGEVAVTKSGLKCQRWDSQLPNDHIYKPERYSKPLRNNVMKFRINPEYKSNIYGSISRRRCKIFQALEDDQHTMVFECPV